MATVNISSLVRDYGEKVADAAREALLENAEIVVEEAKRRCPVNKGKLRDSIHAEKKGKNKVLIVADAQNEKDGYYYGRMLEFSPNGKPFLRPALEAKREELKQNVLNKIRNALNHK